MLAEFTAVCSIRELFLMAATQSMNDPPTCSTALQIKRDVVEKNAWYLTLCLLHNSSSSTHVTEILDSGAQTHSCRSSWMVSGDFAAWYCISIFFKSTDMPSQILYRGPRLCWSLLFLSNCLTRWECSNRFSQSYNLQRMQTESICKKLRRWEAKENLQSFFNKVAEQHVVNLCMIISVTRFSLIAFNLATISNPWHGPFPVFSFLSSLFDSKWIGWSERSLVFLLCNVLCMSLHSTHHFCPFVRVGLVIYLSSHIPSCIN